METYKGEINEFIDWVSGDNTWTGQNETNNLLVSGGSIRKLLLDRLKKPFVLKEDIDNNLYRMFSSETAYQMWLENPSDNADLELFNFVRPSDYKLNITINSSNKYIRYGDSSNLGARIQYSWDIRNNEGESSDSLIATYTIYNTSTGKTSTFTRWYNKGESVDFNIYEYLDEGTNTITISCKGSTTGARNSITYNIVLLQLNVSSTFDFMLKIANGDLILIPCTFTRNNLDGAAVVKFVIDNNIEYTHSIFKNTGTSINTTLKINIDLEPGLHTLQIWAEAEYNDGSIKINSNLLYYTFVVATNDISILKYICISTEFDSVVFPITNLVLQDILYLPLKLLWGYYTDAEQTDTQIQITWKLFKNEDDKSPETLLSTTANTRLLASDLQYIPTIYSEYDESSNPLTFIVAYWENVELIRIPIQVLKNIDVSIYETLNYNLKLSAYGRTNDSLDKTNWNYNNISTNFVGILWNTNSGWYNNSFRTSGISEYAEINYNPFGEFSFTKGKTIEIEFETEKINNNSDKLIVIGNPNAARIEITPTKATLYANNGNLVIYTNYKSNEHIKLAFIINNLPLERTVESGLVYIINNGILERAALASGYEFNTNGNIKIGGSNSGVRVYNIRGYEYPITYTDEYNNYVYDSLDKMSIVTNNNILDSNGEISFDLCKNKLDTILISGNLSMILNLNSDKDDSTTDVTIERICPYDSTKNFKINNVQIRKHGLSTLNYPITSMKLWFNKSKSGVLPVFEIAPQEKNSYNKNRYRMKEDSIPQNKFVLQANYADSSGVHNGGIERLIQSSWYNAKIDGKYLLRTEPQLFTTINSSEKEDYGLTSVWKDYFLNNNFPYELRVSPDSFPCVVFYYDEEGTLKRTFLGLYVFMDDKKSDFLYGERSIYKIPSDPFCLTTLHAKDDTKLNKIWNNSNVLRIEVLESNNRYSSYMSTEGFNERNGSRYGWESAFELIYPDPDDVAEEDEKNGLTKFDLDSEFIKTTRPFIEWYNWLVSTKGNQQKFLQEAADHIDLYKMAAYYIFILRFGLVDSLERNAQIKTYDSIHFHYEPWDMDIALGNKNDGGIAYDPPIDRNTKLPGSVTTYAYSGRSANNNGEIVTSNWLFDALEAWPYWINTIVPKVADALYKAGLTYDNIIKMLDKNYAEAWCESIYNKSGFFKYIESSNGDNEWLNWLQGARMTHRHWWLSSSMDYYDAKWFCGEYKNHYIYITANVSEGSGAKILIYPNKETYITTAINYMTAELTEVNPDEVEVQTTISVSPTNPLMYEVPNLNTKAPFFVYGANFMELIDLSLIATGLDAVDINGVYSEVLGSPLKVLNIGVNLIESLPNIYTGVVATLGGNIRGNAKTLENLLTLYVTGLRNFNDTRFIRDYNLSELKNFYAIGSGIINFWSSESGNNFNKILLPSTVSIFDVNNTTWNDLTFWDDEISENNNITVTLHQGIPSSIQTLRLNGTSCQNINSIEFVRLWINDIVENEGIEGLANHTLEANKVYWTPDSIGEENLLTYDELALIALTNNNLKGYIVLKNQNNTYLTTEQLSQIRTWFGETVFVRNSSGLIIDHMLEYVQINVGGDIEMVDGELFLEEGKRVSLSATKFALSENVSEKGSWAVSYASIDDPSNLLSKISERGIYVISSDSSVDGLTYLLTSESILGGDYDIKVWYAPENGEYSSIVIHMKGVTYPSEIVYKNDSVGLFNPREGLDYTIIYSNNTILDFYLNLGEYSATIKNISYTLTNENGDSFTYNTFNNTTTGNNLLDMLLEVDKNVSKKGLRISCFSGVPNNDTIYKYNLESTIIFKSEKVISNIKHDIIIMLDDIIVNSFKLYLYSTLNSKWQLLYGQEIGRSFYRSDLLTLTGELNFANSELIDLNTSNGLTLLEYLPNIESLNFSNCSNLTGTLVFDNMKLLTLLNIENCSSLTEDIDLSMCDNITEIYASETNISIIIPDNSNLVNYELGTPTNVVINYPNKLIANNFEIDDNSNVEVIEIRRPVRTNCYEFFKKIMKL